jgi:hypothetical protein
VAGYFKLNGFSPRAPEPAADAMLSVSLDFNRALTLRHGILYLLFQNSGLHPLAAEISGNHPWRSIFVSLLVIHLDLQKTIGSIGFIGLDWLDWLELDSTS